MSAPIDAGGSSTGTPSPPANNAPAASAGGSSAPARDGGAPPAPLLPSAVSGWAVNWRSAYLDAALNAVDDPAATLTGIDYFRLNFDTQGRVLGATGQSSAELNLRSHATARNLHQYLTLVNDVIVPGGPNQLKDPALVHEILSDATRRPNLIQSLRDIVSNGQYEGLDLDFENLYASDRAAFTRFVGELATELHRQAKRLIVTVQPQTQLETRNGPGAQDLAAIARSADLVRVMAYHVHYNGTAPGASAPRSWLKTLIQYNLTLIPAAKLSIAYYAGGWKWTGATSAAQLGYADAMSLAQSLGATPSWSNTDLQPWFQGTSNGSTVTVWFESACSLLEKARLAASYGLEDVAFWHLGKEDPAVYSTLRANACS